ISDGSLPSWRSPFSARRDDVHAAAVVPRRTELDRPRHQGEEGVVLTDADVHAREHLGAALTDDDRPRLYLRPGVFLHPEPLAGAVSSVAGRARSLLVSHFYPSIFVMRSVVSSCRCPRVFRDRVLFLYLNTRIFRPLPCATYEKYSRLAREATVKTGSQRSTRWRSQRKKGGRRGSSPCDEKGAAALSSGRPVSR